MQLSVYQKGHICRKQWIISGMALIFVFLTSDWIPASAQRPQYNITANLQTNNHSVTGTVGITYTNHSSTALDKLAIHLWPNAYQHKNTALARQMLRLGNNRLQRAEPHELGGIFEMHFTSSGRSIPLLTDTEHSDIGWLILHEPLAPGATIQFSTPYRLQVPRSFSRMGRTKDRYQLSQWYPHIAVLDEEGWHTMPYLDLGEYYNDFADYEITIQTPPSYTVAATGTLVSSTMHSSHTEWKFTAQKVIDFAWFASTGFIHRRKDVQIEPGTSIELNVYSEEIGNTMWEQAPVYAERALKFYSDWLGPYPYPRMSVVHTPRSSAGYMEYPMVAQISASSDSSFLDLVIAHEIGHTWLYGILANDERTHPWMDEGLNTFLERRYLAQWRPDYSDEFTPSFFHSASSMQGYDALQQILRFNRTLQPPASPPEYQTNNQYLFSAYTLPAQGLEMMMAQLGEDMMKQMFRQYFSDHAFTHVTPEKLRQSFESACHCDLSWYFNDWIHNAHEVDYRITKTDHRKNEVTLRNHGAAVIPVQVSTYAQNRRLSSEWIPGFTGRKIIPLPPIAQEVRLFEDSMVVNGFGNGKIMPKPFLPSVSLYPKVGSYTQNQVSLSPFFGGNLADGFMPGLAIMSDMVPQKKFKFLLAPMYGTESHEFRGHGEARYIGDIHRSVLDKWLISFSVSKFGYHVDTHYLYRDHYVRLSPTIAVRLASPAIQPHHTRWIKYRYVYADQHYHRGINYEEKVYVRELRTYGVHELSYQMRSDLRLTPYTASANVQTGDGFVRMNLRYKQHFMGKSKMHGIWVQGYGGWLPVYDAPVANVMFTFNGLSSNGFFSRDYMYDEWLIGRNAPSGLHAHQVFERDANLKTLSTIGIGDQWMVGGGISAALPLKILHAYMDAALYPASITQKTELSYSGGVAIILVKDIFEVYIPIVESRDIRESLSYVVRDRWFERISFQANFKLFNPLNAVDRLMLGY